MSVFKLAYRSRYVIFFSSTSHVLSEWEFTSICSKPLSFWAHLRSAITLRLYIIYTPRSGAICVWREDIYIYTVETRYKLTRYKLRRAISCGRCWDKRAQYKMFPLGLDISLILAIRVKLRQKCENAYNEFKPKHPN